MSKRNHKPLIHELFKIYKIQRFLLVETGLVLIGAGITPIIEKAHPYARITDFSKGLWWAIVTVTSTGYGDYVPVTFGGKLVGTILMFSGIALFSTMIALVATFFSRRRWSRNSKRTQLQLEELDKRIDKMDKKLEYLVKDKIESKES